MALTTFGAIMGFAAEMAVQAEEIYKALAGMAKAPALKEFLEALSKEEAKNRALMIKARRENVTEMIAEVVASRKLETTGREIIETVHPHPTMSEAVMEAVAAAYGEVIQI